MQMLLDLRGFYVYELHPRQNQNLVCKLQTSKVLSKFPFDFVPPYGVRYIEKCHIYEFKGFRYPSVKQLPPALRRIKVRLSKKIKKIENQIIGSCIKILSYSFHEISSFNTAHTI